METTILIGETEYTARANALTAMIYKNQFQSDILKDTFLALGGMEKLIDIQTLSKDSNDYKTLSKIIESFDTVLIYQLIWAFIKTKDKGLPPFEKWLESLPYIPITELMLNEGFINLLVGNVQRKK